MWIRDLWICQLCRLFFPQDIDASANAQLESGTTVQDSWWQSDVFFLNISFWLMFSFMLSCYNFQYAYEIFFGLLYFCRHCQLCRPKPDDMSGALWLYNPTGAMTSNHLGSVRLLVKPLVLICMADLLGEKNIVPWLISRLLIMAAEHSQCQYWPAIILIKCTVLYQSEY